MADDLPCKYAVEAPVHSQDLLTSLNKLRSEEYLCDLELLSTSGTIFVHRIVMMAASPYFKKKLTGSNEEDKNKLVFDNVSNKCLAEIVEFIYSGRLLISQVQAEELLPIFDALELKSGKLLCQSILNGDVSLQTEYSRKESEKAVGGTREISEESKSKKRRVSRKPQKRPHSESVPMKGFPDWNQDEQTVPPLKLSKSLLTNSNGRTTRSSSRKNKNETKPKKPSPRKKPKEEVKEKKKKRGSTKSKGKKTKDTCTSFTLQKLPSENGQEEEAVDIKEEIPSDDEEAVQESVANFLGDHDEKEDTDSHDNDSGQAGNIGQEDTGDTDPDFVITKTEGVITKNGSNPYKRQPRKCPHCVKVCLTKRSYEKHLKSHDQEALPRGNRRIRQEHWPCIVCGRMLTSAVRQACHHYSKHGIPYDKKLKLHECKVEGCKYVTASRHYLQIHEKGKHSAERPHVCHFCGKGFKLPSALVTHLNIHTLNKIYKCSDCDLTFNQKGGLDIHMKKKHMGEASWSELCHLCSEKFLHKAELCWHMYKIHQVPLPDRYKVFKCDLCNYQTIRKNKLQRHMDAHEDKRMFTCEICGKKFVTKSYLNRHVKYHGEKSFRCTFEGCSYACVDQVGLNKHVRLMHTHKDYKPFMCSLCPYKTGLRGNLDKHIRTVHNLEVVTKHTVHLKMKFKDRKSGDIITKQGDLFSDATDRPMAMGTEIIMNRKEDEMLLISSHQDSRNEEPEEGEINAAASSASQIVTADRELLPHYVFAQGQVIPGSAQNSFSLVTNDARMTLAGQMAQAELYSMDPMAFVATKFTDHDYF